jgi:hypothetical protein
MAVFKEDVALHPLIDGLMNGYMSQWPLIPSPDASELGW